MDPIRRDDKRIWARFLYKYNELYNRIFRLILGNLTDEKIKQGCHYSSNKESILRANATQSAWLLNINRSFKLIRDLTSLDNIELKKMRWIDVGCGYGLTSLYVACRYRIKKQYVCKE